MNISEGVLSVTAAAWAPSMALDEYRGQAWVAKRLVAALPRVPENARPALQAMLDSHVANIGSCEALL